MFRGRPRLLDDYLSDHRPVPGFESQPQRCSEPVAQPLDDSPGGLHSAGPKRATAASPVAPFARTISRPHASGVGRAIRTRNWPVAVLIAMRVTIRSPITRTVTRSEAAKPDPRTTIADVDGELTTRWGGDARASTARSAIIPRHYASSREEPPAGGSS